MKKDFLAYICTRMDCVDNCRLVLISRSEGAPARGGAEVVGPTAILERLLHKDCGRYLVPVPESVLPTAEPFEGAPIMPAYRARRASP